MKASPTILKNATFSPKKIPAPIPNPTPMRTCVARLTLHLPARRPMQVPSRVMCGSFGPSQLDDHTFNAVGSRKVVDARPQRSPEPRHFRSVLAASHDLVDFA